MVVRFFSSIVTDPFDFIGLTYPVQWSLFSRGTPTFVRWIFNWYSGTGFWPEGYTSCSHVFQIVCRRRSLNSPFVSIDSNSLRPFINSRQWWVHAFKHCKNSEVMTLTLRRTSWKKRSGRDSFRFMFKTLLDYPCVKPSTVRVVQCPSTFCSTRNICADGIKTFGLDEFKYH